MFFKSLELNGFKSFATKTTVEFQPGVTVIVGPNGCGKSNIFDAIRWVLGEQNARHLRGGRMSDVIFSGSSSLKAQGLAQVSLTVRNEDGRLPIDFSEVNVTRRLYADGQSEYLLNKTPCRLKDITDLFLDTGIGAEGYSIMEQGRVDAIINSKPLERRAIFEEAAGVAKYKARRGEALRKLERADADFVRLSDLIAEVRRQSNSLKRQAGKAERFKALTEEGKVVERLLLARRHEALQVRLGELTREHDALRDRLASLSARIAQAEADQEQARAGESEIEGALAGKRARRFEIASEIERGEHGIALLRERIAEAERRIAQTGEETEVDSREEMALAAELGTARRDTAAEQVRLAETQAFLTETQSEFDSLRSGLQGAMEELDALRRRLSGTLEKKIGEENAVRLSRVLIQRLNDQIEIDDRKHEEQRAGANHLEARVGELGRRRAEADTSLEALRSGQAARAEENEALERAVAALREEAEVLEGQINVARSKLRALEQLESTYQGYYQGVRSVMQARDEGRLHGLIGVVAQLVRASAEHEIAIEAGLGSQLQDIVALTADEARDAVQFLKSGSLGRATFLPLDLLEVRETGGGLQDALRQPGVIGLASRLVESPPEVEKAIRFLLGGTIVVESLDRAIALEREGRRFRYVSLDGQIVSPQGVISGGHVKESGLLSRERELRELRETCQAGGARIDEMRGRLAGLQGALSMGRTRAAELSEAVHGARIASSELAKDLDLCRASLEEKRRELAAYEEQRAAWLDEIHTHRFQIEEREGTIASLAAEAGACEQSLRSAQDRMSAQDTQVDALSGSLSEMRAEMAAIQERLARLHSRGERLGKRQVALSQAQSRRRQETQAMRERQRQAGEEIESARAGSTALQERRKEVEREIAESERARDETILSIRQSIQSLHALQSERNDLSNEAQEAALRRNEAEVQIANLNQMAQERFQSTVEELSRPGGDEATAERRELAALPQEELHSRLVRINEILSGMGLVNLAALEEYDEAERRLEFLTGQENDLNEARRQLTETIASIDETTKTLFYNAFESIRAHFIEMFRRLFGGGRADLILSDVEGGDSLLDGGIEIVAQPPGKKLQNISLLSGGEKALTAISLLFGIFLYKPSPFCVLDEIDAPLDDANIERFKKLLLEFARETQFIIITHSKQTMTLADAIYGVTMEEAGVSKLVSVRFEESLSLVG